MAGSDAKQQELLSSMWYDSAWIPSLNTDNVIDYFSQRSNPFYDRTCNNEVIRMQRGDLAQLDTMQGTEYRLLHVQEPILYIVRKAHRQSPDKVTPLADYYILNGIVYQCPDLQSIVNSRLLSALNLVHSAFSEAISYARYDPSKGYYWEFPEDCKADSSAMSSVRRAKTEEPSEAQRRRVDTLLGELVRKFPLKALAGKEGGRPIMFGGGLEKNKSSGESKESVSAVTGGIKRPAQFGPDSKMSDPKRKRT